MTLQTYEIKIELIETPRHPITYFREERKCKTVKGAQRQAERIVSETIEAWRQLSPQIRCYSITPVIR